MISGGCGVLFAAFCILMGTVFVIFGISEPYWTALIVGLAFVAFGAWLARNSLTWLRYSPANSLTLFANHFRVGNRCYPYASLLRVDVHHSRMHKTLNLLPAGIDATVVACLHLRDEQVFLRAGSGPTTLFGPSIGGAETDDFLQTLATLKQRAADSKRASATSEVQGGGIAP
jgi:hypothetical protein